MIPEMGLVRVMITILLDSPFVTVTIEGALNSFEGSHMVVDGFIPLGLDEIIFIVEVVILVVGIHTGFHW